MMPTVNEPGKPEPASEGTEPSRTGGQAAEARDGSAAGQPPLGVPAPAASRPLPPRTRREGGPRQNVSEPVVFHLGTGEIDGWTLNMSRGGLRAVVEEQLAVGEVFEVSIGESGVRRPVRVVWVREQRGSAIIGLSFLDLGGPPGEPPEDTHAG